MRLFEKYFPLPFRLDDWGMYVWAGPDCQMVLQFDDEYEDDNHMEFKKKIIAAINGDETIKLMGHITHNHGEISIDGKYLMCIRGWGMLTGVLKLSDEEAVTIQDDLANYIVEKLTI